MKGRKYPEISIILVGSGADGKSSIILRYVDNKFPTSYLSTLGIDIKSKQVTMLDGKEIKVKIFDTAGQERFMNISKNYFSRANGIIINYDITDQKSFEMGKIWINAIKEDFSLRKNLYF